MTNHYQSFISTSSEITTIENDMLKLNNLLGQFQVSLKVLSGAISFSYEDAALGAKMKAIEKQSGGSSSGGTDLLGSSSSGSNQHASEVELEELLEELRSWIYERRFEKAITVLDLATEKARRRARELGKQQLEEKSDSGSGLLATAGSSASGDASASTTFRAIAGDLLDLRATLIEMLFSELRAAATASAIIGGKAGAASPRGGKRASTSSGSVSSATASSATFQLQSLVGHLIHLRQTKKTLQVFLYQVKSAHLRSSIKSIKFTGDILSYIGEFSSKFFLGLGATVGEFQRLFVLGGAQEGEGGWTAGAASDAGGGISKESKFVNNPAALSSYLMRWVLHELLTTYNTIFPETGFSSRRARSASWENA